VAATRQMMGVSPAPIDGRRSAGNGPEPTGAGERRALRGQRTRGVGGGSGREETVCGPAVWAWPMNSNISE
jgi:hypothetical protein